MCISLKAEDIYCAISEENSALVGTDLDFAVANETICPDIALIYGAL